MPIHRRERKSIPVNFFFSFDGLCDRLDCCSMVAEGCGGSRELWVAARSSQKFARNFFRRLGDVSAGSTYA